MKDALPTCFGAALAALSLGLAGQASAAANDTEAIELTVNECHDISFTELRRLLSVELAGRPALAVFSSGGSSEGANRIPLRVVVDCWNPDSWPAVAVSLVDIDSGQTVSKPIDLAGVPVAHRPRFLAIAIVELMSEPNDWTSPTPERKPPAPSNAAPVPGETASFDTNHFVGPPLQWRFDVAAVTLRTSGLDPFLWGGLARVGRQLSDWLVAELEVESAGNSVPISLGRAQIMFYSASASVLARLRLPPLEWDAGMGARAGLVRLAGTPGAAAGTSVRSGTVLGPWGGPFLFTRLGADAGRHLSFLLGVEGGYSPGRVAGMVDGVTQVSITQLWTSFSLGVGWRQ